MIQLKSLHIKGTDVSKGNKNFIDTDINFSDSSKYCAFIGLNASGKSNLLEIISKIFAGLYKPKKTEFKPDFGYIIKYNLNDLEIEIELRKNPSEMTYYFKVNEVLKSKAQFERNISQYVPSKIISNYSGEESRLWEETYNKFYEDYFKGIKKSVIVKNQMNYINKYNWDMALISLLFIDDNYIKEVLNLESVSDIRIIFDFDTTKYSHYGENPVMDFIRSVNAYNQDAITTTINNLISGTNISGDNSREKALNLFNFLYISYMPKNKKIITHIEVQFKGITTKQLSEGQKKLILVRFITHLLSDENALLLFDEPDSHIHVSRKEKLAELINESPAYSLLTTHSPALINFLDEKSVQLLKPHDVKGVEAVKIDKLKQIESITENSMSLMDTSLVISTKKHILMCEGVNDINYIRHALKVLNRTQHSKYEALNNILLINCGGAHNVKPVFSEIVKDYLNESQICVITFDDDKPGRDCKILFDELIQTEDLRNVKVMLHPKISGFTGDFYMEDYFSLDAYKTILLDKINNANNFKTADGLEKAKNIISNKYKTFDDNNFNNFHVLFDKLMNQFELN